MVTANYTLDKEVKIKLAQSTFDSLNTWLTIGELNITLSDEQLAELENKIHNFKEEKQ